MTFPAALARPWAAAAFAALTAASLGRADTVNTRELQVRELATGVYTIRHPDPTDDFPRATPPS
jgi:hypothetical protein